MTSILRLIFLFFVGLFVRRLFSKPAKASSGAPRSSGSFKAAGKNNNDPETVESMRDITEQEIDDADFEEIP